LHEIDLIHCDIKPRNLLVPGDGNEAGWTITDYGIVEAAGDVSPEPTPQTNLGLLAILRAPDRDPGMRRYTLGYAPPESLRPGALSPKVDIFSLGVTVIKAATGKLPFDITTQERYIYSVTHESPVFDAKDQASMPAELISLIRECIRHDPEDRPTAEETASRMRAIPV
jgi:serine/threonine protein kinase